LAPPDDLVFHHRDVRGRPAKCDGPEAQEEHRKFAQAGAAIISTWGRDRGCDFSRRLDHRDAAASVRDGRQHQKLPTHRGLMHEALEDEHTLAMKGEDPRSLFKRWELLVHHDVEVGTEQREIVLVVAL
jgi:hypothetical protein